MDRDKIEAFLEHFVELASGATTIGLLAVAERSGLSAFLGEHGGGTVEEIAERAGLEPRYVEEILCGLAAARVVDYNPDTATFILPPEHALFLSSEASPYFMGGWFDLIPAMIRQLEGITAATVEGGGVSFEEFGPAIIKGIDRGNAPSQRAFLTSRWLPAVPGLVARLEAGIRVADVGCGSGTAATLIAQAYPGSAVSGFDLSYDSITVASSRAKDIPNVEFHLSKVEDIPLDPGFDLITSFDVIHDLVDPLGGLSRIRQALRPEGVFLMMEPNVSSNLEENLHPSGALIYGVSALHCMTQSLAHGGEGLGAAWGRQKAEEHATKAGFGSFTPLPSITNRFSAFYLLTP